MEKGILLRDSEFDQINQLYDECLNYLKNLGAKDCDKYYIPENFINDLEEPGYETIKIKHDEASSDENTYEVNGKSKGTNENPKTSDVKSNISDGETVDYGESNYKVENELLKEIKSERLRRLSQQLPKIVITQSNTSINIRNEGKDPLKVKKTTRNEKKLPKVNNGTINCAGRPSPSRRQPYGDFQKRLVSKNGIENVAQISNVPFEKIRLLNDTFHTLINLRWRWIVMGTVVVHFTIWLVFAVFWYIAALAHYDFAPDPPARSCVTGGKDFLTIFLASVEAQTTIGFGDRAIDEECPESIFLFIMQLILGTGLSGVLTCVVYAKLTRPEKLSRDGVGFSKKAVICMRDGQLCLMIRAWDLNYDHIICSEFSAHFINTYKTKEGEIIRYYARNLPLQQRQFLLWPVTLVHVIDQASPLYRYTPDLIANNSYEITVSLKGASASMGTFTQSQTSYTPREVLWGHRFPPVVKYDGHKQKYVIDHKKLDAIEPVDTPFRSAFQLDSWNKENPPTPSPPCPDTPSNFSEKISAFVLERTSSFRNNKKNEKP